MSTILPRNGTTKSALKSATTLAIVVACGIASCFVTGCADDEAAASAEDKPLSGTEIARGVLGVPRGATGDDAKAADAVIAEMEKEFPGRLAQVEKDLASRDPARIENAKHLLDDGLNTGAESPALGGVPGSGVEQSLNILSGSSGSLTNGSGKLSGGGTQLVTHPAQLSCAQPKDANGAAIHLGRGANGKYGDDRTGAIGAAEDTADLVDTTDINVFRTLSRVDSGELHPDPESRLGAYAATRGYPSGTVGYAVHNAIGTIYAALANYGQEKIGRVFNSPQAKALYNQPVSSCASYQVATLEYQYWQDVRHEDPASPGGNLGSAFNPSARNALQQHVFGGN